MLTSNHAIAAIEHGGKTYWIDATHSNQGGSIETMDQARYGSALVIGNPKTSLVHLTDVPVKHKVETFVTFDFRKPDDITMQVEAEYIYGNADSFRNYRSHYILDEIT